jgi:hypothetical protein
VCNRSQTTENVDNNFGINDKMAGYSRILFNAVCDGMRNGSFTDLANETQNWFMTHAQSATYELVSKLPPIIILYGKIILSSAATCQIRSSRTSMASQVILAGTRFGGRLRDKHLSYKMMYHAAVVRHQRERGVPTEHFYFAM